MESGTSVVCPEVVMALPHLSPSAAKLAIALGRFEGPDRTCWPSNKTLMAATGISHWAIFQRARRELFALGLRWKSGRGRSSTRYWWEGVSEKSSESGNVSESVTAAGAGSENISDSASEKGSDQTPHGTPQLSAQKEEGEKATKCECEALVEAWNRLAEAEKLPKVLALTTKRRRALAARLRDPEWRTGWREAVDKIRECPFLLGENDRGWRADFDWFLRPDTVIRILEGQYAGAPTARTPFRSGRRFASADQQRDKFDGIARIAHV